MGYIIGSQKNAGAAGFWTGALFGPLGVIASLAFDFRQECFRCGTKLNGEPEICPSCHTEQATGSATTTQTRSQRSTESPTALSGEEAEVVKAITKKLKCLHCNARVTAPTKSRSSWKCPLCSEINLTRA